MNTMKQNTYSLRLVVLLGLCCALLITGCTPTTPQPTPDATTSSDPNPSTTATSPTATSISTTPGDPTPSTSVPGLEGDNNGPMICIDPGHPSEVNSGETVQNGTTEVQMCWDVGNRLERLIAQDSSLRNTKTRSAVKTLTTNRRRAEIANEAGATLMVRLHCDTGAGSGFAVYYPDRQGTTQGMTGPSQDVITKSRAAAEAMVGGLAGALQGKLNNNGIKGESVSYVGAKQGALTGSIFSKVPTITIEMVYLSNAADAAFIKSAEGQDLLARGLYEGIKTYVKTAKP
jgi:N-acetylmuramoyl-L-alanine amidase